jgi:hypothetical protein
MTENSPTRRPKWGDVAMIVCFGMLFVLVLIMQGNDNMSTNVDVTTDKLMSLSSFRLFLKEVMGAAQVQIESGMKASGLIYKTNKAVLVSDLVESIQRKHTENESKAKASSSSLSFNGAGKTTSIEGILLGGRELGKDKWDGDRESEPKNVLDEHKEEKVKVATSQIILRPDDCRCEYPGEFFYTQIPLVAVRGSKSKNGSIINPLYRRDKNGMLVLPFNHPSCRNIVYICPGDEEPDIPAWTCPNFDAVPALGSIGQPKGKGKGTKSKNGSFIGGCHLGDTSKGKGKGSKKKNDISIGTDCMVGTPSYIILPEKNPLCLPCRCQYPSEDFYDDFLDPCDLLTTLPASFLEIGDAVVHDGVLVLPRFHPSCKCARFICPAEIEDGDVEWQCPDNKQKLVGFGSFIGLGGSATMPGLGLVSGKSKGKGKGSKSKKSSSTIGGIDGDIIGSVGDIGASLPPCECNPDTVDKVIVSLPREACAPTPAAAIPASPILSFSDCKDPYDTWVACVVSESCRNCVSLPGGSRDGGLVEDCDAFGNWIESNFQCCRQCTDQLKRFKECKPCSTPPTPSGRTSTTEPTMDAPPATAPNVDTSTTDAPTATPPQEEAPTIAPYSEAPTAVTTGICSGETIYIDFENGSDGNDLEGGTCVSDEWSDDGLTLLATGCDEIPCLLDSSCVSGSNHVRGSPNKNCEDAGPGRGTGGKPGAEGENCVPQKNVLVNDCGTMIVFDFAAQVSQVFEIGLINIVEDGSFITLTFEDGTTEDLGVPVLGKNSVQMIEINKTNVVQVKVTFTELSAVTSLSYCIEPETPAPFESGPPNLPPSPGGETEEPTVEPTTEPTVVIPEVGKLKGSVFEDKNANGLPDTGELGIPGVDVVVIDSTGETFTLTTDENGMYMTNLAIGPASTNIVKGTLPPGYTQTAGVDPTTVVVPAGGTAAGIDGYQFPEKPIMTSSPTPTRFTSLQTSEPLTSVPTLESVVPMGKLEGIVFQDSNRDGVQDTDEPGIAQVEVVVTDSIGETITLTTNADGVYSANVPIGSTKIVINESTLHPDYEQTISTDPATIFVPDEGIATILDGYYFPTDTPTRSPAAAQTSFGKVKGIVFWDKDGDGTQGPDKLGIPNVDVVVTDVAGETRNATTDENGEYMVVVPVGAALVDINESTLPNGANQTAGTNPTRVAIAEGGTAIDIDGYQLPLGKIEGIVFEDKNGNEVKDTSEPGISGVDVVITDNTGISRTVATNKEGVYMEVVPVGPIVTNIVESMLPPTVKQTAGSDPTTVVVSESSTSTDSDGFQVSPADPPTFAPLTPEGGTPAPSPAPTKFCIAESVTFDTAANGTALPGGEYVQNEWLAFGLFLSCSGKNVLGDIPRLFNTSDPVDGEFGDLDLGSPNQGCNPSGPGIGSGGAPGAPGENCDPLGNVLMCQEDNDNPDIPDDASKGGVITFEFTSDVVEVTEIGLLDVSKGTEIIVETFDGTDMKAETVPVPRLGENANQTVSINKKNIVKLKVIMSKSGAVTFISFCRGPETMPPVFIGPPSAPTQDNSPTIASPTGSGPTNVSPTFDQKPTPGSGTEPTSAGPEQPPTKAPLTPSSPTPLECINAMVNFNELPDGTKLNGGDYLGVQYKPFYGLEFSSSGGIRDIPRLFDTTRVGNQTYGDSDLGSPNRKCPGGGPGIGFGGAPGPEGDNPYRNCEFLGNVLIIQEDNGFEEQPDDNQDGGTVTMDFSPTADEVYEIGLLDVDYPLSITIVYIDDEGTIQEKPPVDVPVLGNNSNQTVALNEKNVVQLRLNLSRSGATTFLSFCYTPPAPTPTPSIPAPISGTDTSSPSFSPSESPSDSPSERPINVPSESPSMLPSPRPPSNAPTTPEPPTRVPRTTAPSRRPTPSGTDCEAAYGEYVLCIFKNEKKCSLCDSASPGLKPGDKCDEFFEWYNSNKVCCDNDECGEELEALKGCKDCNTPAPTASPTVSPTKAPPTPAVPTRSPPTTVPPIASPTKSPTSASTSRPTKSPTVDPTISPTPVVPLPPTPSTVTSSPTFDPTLRPTIEGLDCKNPFDDWVSCVEDIDCNSCDTAPPGQGGLTPEEDCEIFFLWDLANTDCCERCENFFEKYSECKDCNPSQTPSPSQEQATQLPTAEQTPAPTPTPTSRPTPGPTAPEPECKESYEEYAGCVEVQQASDRCIECDTSLPGNPDDALTPSEDCKAFRGFYRANTDCCERCSEELEGFRECKDCTTQAPTPTPSLESTSPPTSRPTPRVTSEPSPEPTPAPTVEPTTLPTSEPLTPEPTPRPTPRVTPQPTREPTSTTTSPTAEPTTSPTSEPTTSPTSEPLPPEPTPRPTPLPTREPTSRPTTEPFAPVPTSRPTLTPPPSPGTITPLPSTTPECFKPYKDWEKCVEEGKCGDCDTSSPGKLIPGEDCQDFIEWAHENLQCGCDKCAKELDSLKECKECEFSPTVDPWTKYPTPAPSLEEFSPTVDPWTEYPTPAPSMELWPTSSPSYKDEYKRQLNEESGNLRATAFKSKEFSNEERHH